MGYVHNDDSQDLSNRRRRAAAGGANDRIRTAAIGTGGRCQALMRAANQIGGIEWVALADVNEVRAREAKTNLAPSATIYADFKLREDRPASCSCRRCCRRFHPGGILPAASIIGFITLFGIDT